ncbi:MAG: DNA polymerase III subunit delta, partial [Desulfosalsimonas sp.]
ETKGQAGQTANDAAILEAAVERGFPKNHHLIIVTSRADKRKRLYKAVAAAGTVIDCAVATGSRKADLDEQRQVLRQLAAETLGPRKKNLEPAAFEHIFDLTGFDPRSFVNNLEKLALYTAERSRITAADAAQALEKTREDPIYLFTGALAERRPDMALYYLDSLLASGYHPMQLLTAAANQMRRILAVKSFVEDTAGGSQWQPSMPFDRFRARVLPQVVEHDKAVSQYALQVKQGLGMADESGKDKAGTDMVIAKNPKNPYPVYQVFIQADRFTGRELSQALSAIARADLSMKSTATQPRAVLESLIFSVFVPVSESFEKTNSTSGVHSYNVRP